MLPGVILPVPSEKAVADRCRPSAWCWLTAQAAHKRVSKKVVLMRSVGRSHNAMHNGCRSASTQSLPVELVARASDQAV